ncbi:GAF domain-containing protein [Deinococcus aestuarii]|uniref:GAF domain-containing protein n=1 Tax=Deinococcus aestuarii TaxID=2774531 RepID=UPI001C0ABD3D|nr:GAF domain-containing protein [Deinococcus aestuarii]
MTSPPEVVEVLTAGVPLDAPSYAEAVETREVVFVPGWEAEREGVARTEAYGAGAFSPCFVGDAPRGLLAMGTQRAGDWSAREQAVFRSVGRSLTLALERVEAARRLTAQNAGLDARTRALEAFAELSRDLSLQGDPHALIRRAGEVALSLLPGGSVLLYEPARDRWRAAVQVGAPSTPPFRRRWTPGSPSSRHTTC